MSPLETPEAMAARVCADGRKWGEWVAADAIREDRRVIAEAAEREAEAVDGKPGESDMEQIVGVGQAAALRAFARALRGEP